jgi:hypothetical protein|tara:strand:+ start:464 stop:607 length:144 start_codon:yes stop_codon:yes gene_type:complete
MMRAKTAKKTRVELNTARADTTGFRGNTAGFARIIVAGSIVAGAKGE